MTDWAIQNFVSKKERERLERQKAERESKACSESKCRQERIKVLWKALTSGSLAPKDKQSADSEPLRSLAELVDLQKREIEHLTEFCRKLWWICAYRGELSENLSVDGRRELQFVATLLRIGEKHPFTKRSAAKQCPKTWFDYKRRGYNRDGIGEIERQFGLGYNLSSALSPYGPHCLDEIFKRGAVNMWRLQQLFGMHRNRFPKKLPRFTMGRERLYDYRAVVEIMNALLKPKLPEHKMSTRGRSLRLWPRPDLRTHVLSRIEARLESLSVEEDIKATFLKVIRGHRPDSAKK
jgi:hypothetical protein